MVNVTLAIPEETRRRMAAHSGISWSDAIRTMIEARLDALEEFDRFAARSTLTRADVDRMAAEVDAKAGAHARRLLDEAGR